MEVDLPPTQTNDEVMDAEPTKEVSFRINFDTSNHWNIWERTLVDWDFIIEVVYIEIKTAIHWQFAFSIV